MSIPLGAKVMVRTPAGKPMIAKVTADMGDNVLVGRAHHGVGFVSAIVPASDVLPVDDALNALRRAADAGRPIGTAAVVPAYLDAVLAYVADLEARCGEGQAAWVGGEE